MPNNKPKPYIFIEDVKALSIIQTTDEGYCEDIVNLMTLIEQISGTDGVQIQVSKVTLGIRLAEDSDNSFTVVPVVVQTAGTFSDQINLASSKVAELLNSGIDDVFGYYPLGNVRISRSYPNIGSNSQKVETTVQLPQHLVNLLNKETETERLQNLWLGITGKTADAGSTLTGEAWLIIEYTERRKNIVIR